MIIFLLTTRLLVVRNLFLRSHFARKGNSLSKSGVKLTIKGKPCGKSSTKTTVLNNKTGKQVRQTNNSNSLIHKIGSVENLVKAYESIKSFPGNITPGTDNTTLDGIRIKWIEEVSKLIIAGKFKFRDARRVNIPKNILNPNDSRPLSIAGPRDKVIQKAIQQVLEDLFEPMIRDRSHGFRPGRSCHTALKAVGMAG